MTSLVSRFAHQSSQGTPGAASHDRKIISSGASSRLARDEPESSSHGVTACQLQVPQRGGVPHYRVNAANTTIVVPPLPVRHKTCVLTCTHPQRPIEGTSTTPSTKVGWTITASLPDKWVSSRLTSMLHYKLLMVPVSPYATDLCYVTLAIFRFSSRSLPHVAVCGLRRRGAQLTIQAEGRPCSPVLPAW
jgi:hypothetical protein